MYVRTRVVTTSARMSDSDVRKDESDSDICKDESRGDVRRDEDCKEKS